MFFAFVPLSIISIFVITPILLTPFGSNSLANYNPSLVVMSAFAGMTTNIIVLGSPQYLLTMLFVIPSMSSC